MCHGKLWLQGWWIRLHYTWIRPQETFLSLQVSRPKSPWRGQRAFNARQGKLCLRHACVAQSCPFLPIFAYSCLNSYNIFSLMVYHLLGTYSQLTMYLGQLSLVSALSWMSLFRTRLGQVHFFLGHVFGFRPLTILLSFGSSLVVPRCFSLGRLPL